MIKNISNLGDAAVYCDFGKDVNQEINTNVIKYFKNIKDKNIEGITNITPSYNKLIETPSNLSSHVYSIDWFTIFFILFSQSLNSSIEYPNSLAADSGVRFKSFNSHKIN